MLPIPKEIKTNRQKKIAEIEERIDRAIQKAMDEGRHSCCFLCDLYGEMDAPFYDEIKEKYLRGGYIIKPTGYIGGVWQRTEDICW